MNQRDFYKQWIIKKRKEKEDIVKWANSPEGKELMSKARKAHSDAIDINPDSLPF